MKRLKILIGLILILSIGLACNLTGGETSEPTPPPQEQATNEPQSAATPVEVPSQDPLENIRNSTVLIEATGSFVDPEMGEMYNVAGRGTGVIIDPSGIVVTNNHVVTGAATIKVWIAGENQARNATVLGVSECWDLAVIDVFGDDLPYLEFYQGEVIPGLEVYAAGFPLGDPEYTLTKGIVSKANASGVSFWASVGAVIEHDARIRGGNSGGPLVDTQGRIVGINYAGNDLHDQNFAIRAKDAMTVIDTLRSGDDFESIGINGQAVVSEDGTLSGIWVSSVKSGSPADVTGLQGGDIITQMEGLVLATDGSMADYCDILRTRGSEDTLSIEVLRFASEEYLSGQLNGRTLETKFSFAQELGDDVSNSTGSYSEYVLVQDDYGAIQVSVPTIWAEMDGSPWYSDGEVIGSSISASADLARFNDYYDEPGVFFGVSDDVAALAGYIQLLDAYRDIFGDACTLEGRFDYEDIVYEGSYDVYTGCAGTQNTMIVLTARPIENKTALLVSVLVNIMSDADLDALDEVLNTFDVVGSLP